jgi:hypothetical protein
MTNAKPFAIPKASAAGLRGRQSTRVAFKLTPKCVDAINILGSHLRLKPKSLFDHMVQERSTLEAIAEKAKAADSDGSGRMVKTYVISKDAADVLNQVAGDRQIARDTLVEASVVHLMPLIEKELVRHNLRKKHILRIKRHLKSGLRLRDDIIADMGTNDPMSDSMANVMASYERAYTALERFIKKGEGIEDFDAES